MTAPADCLVSNKVLLFSDHTFFSPSFYLFVTHNCNYKSILREALKMKFSFTFDSNLSKN